MSHSWSPQQAAFLDWAVNGSGSCVLEAVAGAGKTTVVIEAACTMPGQIAVLSYNSDIAVENKAKLAARLKDHPEPWRKAQAGTVHSYGFAPLRKRNPGVVVDDKKVSNILAAMLPHDPVTGVPHRLWVYRGEAAKLVSLAKQMSLGVSGGAIADKHVWLEMADHYDVFDHDEVAPPVNEVVELAQAALVKSNADLDVVDFDDMVYLPLVHKLYLHRFDGIACDEAQDTNAARRDLMRAMLKRGGRMMAVGDRHQAIYGFTGADSDSLDLIAKEFNAIYLPLTTTFRCPKTVVEFAQQWVNHIQAADTAPEGSVSTIDMEAFVQRNDLDGSAAVLSRTNKPLVSLAFALIRRRIPCKIEGRKDIGEGLKKLLTRWKISTLDALERKLGVYLEQQTVRLLAQKKEQRLADIEDQVETVKVIIDQCRSERKYHVADAVAYCDTLFGERVSGILVLSSIHKAKGREWTTTFWLDRLNTCPSKWARQQWQQEQEINLCYVAATRAKAQLIEITVPAKEM